MNYMKEMTKEEIFLKENEALLLRADRFEAERNELEFKYKKLLEECDKLTKENHKMELEIIHNKAVIKHMHQEKEELKAENEKLKTKIEERIECGAACGECKNKCRAWLNGFNAKGGNISFDSIQMLRRIVKEVEPEWIDKNCISCAWFNNLKGVGGYCAYHNNKTTAKGGCNKWAKEVMQQNEDYIK